MGLFIVLMLGLHFGEIIFIVSEELPVVLELWKHIGFSIGGGFVDAGELAMLWGAFSRVSHKFYYCYEFYINNPS